MGKTIRPTYPVEISVGLLFLIFVLSFFLSSQLFKIPWHDLSEGTDIYFGMFLVSSSVVIMVLILWEEFLFPVQVKEVEGGVVFRNHRTKLIKQLLIYFTIPAIFGFIYFTYDVQLIRFIIWAAICVITPIAAKLVSGINNYNDFLTLTNEAISYKNNEKEGIFNLKEIEFITLINDERNVLHKIQVSLQNKSQVTIDLDEMELEAFYVSINEFIITEYKNLLKDSKAIG